MEWAISVGTNLASAVIGGFAVWIWRRWWNPSVWKFTFLKGGTWTLTRLGRRIRHLGISAAPGPGDPLISRYNDRMTWGDVVVTDEMRWDALSLDRGESINFDHVVEGWGYILHWYTRGKQRDAPVIPSKGQLPVLIRKRDVKMSTFDKTFGEKMQRDLYTNLVTGAHTEYPGGVTAEEFMRRQTPTPHVE